MKKISLFKFSLAYAKNYFLESLAVHFPQIVPKPLYVGLSVGTVCNFKCRQCDLWRVKSEPERYLSTKEVKKILLSLKEWLGPFRLTFTGAEPFVRKDMIKILTFAAQNDIYTAVTSNGWLINKKLAAEIVQSQADLVNISLDGVDAQTHDFLRGKKGAFKKACQALKHLSQMRGDSPRPAIYINTVVMTKNLGQLDSLVALNKEFGLDAIRFQALESKWLFGAQEYDPFWFKKDPLWPREKDKIERMFVQLKALKRKGNPIKNTLRELEGLNDYYLRPTRVAERHRFCFTGVRNFAIDEYGQVKLCFGMAPVGDLRRQKPKKIWYSKRAKHLRGTIRHCQRYCRILPCNKRAEVSQMMGAFFKNLNL